MITGRFDDCHRKKDRMTSRILTRRPPDCCLRGSSVLRREADGRLLEGCGSLGRATRRPSGARVGEDVEGLTYRSQRLLLGSGDRGGEFRESDCRRYFRFEWHELFRRTDRTRRFARKCALPDLAVWASARLRSAKSPSTGHSTRWRDCHPAHR